MPGFIYLSNEYGCHISILGTVGSEQNENRNSLKAKAQLKVHQGSIKTQNHHRRMIIQQYQELSHDNLFHIHVHQWGECLECSTYMRLQGCKPTDNLSLGKAQVL